MNKSVLISRVLITVILFFAGCSSHEQIRLTSKVDGRESNTARKRFFSSALLKNEHKKISEIKTERYLLRLKGWSPLSRIINRAVDDIIRGNTDGAETILLEVRSVDDTGTAENNLAVIYELSGRKRLAFTGYYNALLTSPDNDLFKKNFFSSTYSPASPVRK